MVAAEGGDHRARPGGARLARRQGLRSRVRRAPDGAAHRARGEEAAVGVAPLRVARGRRHASGWSVRGRRDRAARTRTPRRGRRPAHEPLAQRPPRLPRRAAAARPDADADPFEQFTRWFEQVRDLEADPTAMALATATRDGRPSARMVLLKGVDERGFVFYTNYRSRKAREIGETRRASLLFYWPSLERQVRIEGAGRRGHRRGVGRLLRHAAAREPLECRTRRRRATSSRAARQLEAALPRSAAAATASTCRGPRGGAATASFRSLRVLAGTAEPAARSAAVS